MDSVAGGTKLCGKDKQHSCLMQVPGFRLCCYEKSTVQVSDTTVMPRSRTADNIKTKCLNIS